LEPLGPGLSFVSRLGADFAPHAAGTAAAPTRRAGTLPGTGPRCPGGAGGTRSGRIPAALGPASANVQFARRCLAAGRLGGCPQITPAAVGQLTLRAETTPVFGGRRMVWHSRSACASYHQALAAPAPRAGPRS